MDLLSAVNSILPKLGEHPVTSVTRKHPTLAIILPVIESTVDTVCMRGWWFNEFPYTVYPDSEGKASVPVDTLEYLPDESGPVVRGGEFFNLRDNTNRFSGPFQGVIKVRVEFEKLPETVAKLVLYTALVEVYLTDIGLENVVQAWQSMAATAEAQATSEHLRNMRHSTQKSRRYRRIRNAMRG